MISVIIPNYNYSTFLRKRLNSIIQIQPSYINEIIFLDDASDDYSVEIVKKIFCEQDISYKIIVNKKNSGSVFSQWEKGISMCTGEYIWIAESDDVSDLSFLPTLYDLISSNSKIGLVYSESAVINNDGYITDKDFFSRIHSEISDTHWSQSFVNKGSDEITSYLAIRNTIPNASGVLFRASAIRSVIPFNFEYKFSGDWFIYIKILENWDIGFVPKKLNYHRQHDKSLTSKSDNTMLYYTEAISISRYIRSKFDLDSDVIEKFINNLLNQAHLTGTMSDELLNLLVDEFGSEVVYPLLSQKYNSISHEFLEVKKDLFYRLGKISWKKILKRLKRRKV